MSINVPDIHRPAPVKQSLKLQISQKDAIFCETTYNLLTIEGKLHATLIHLKNGNHYLLLAQGQRIP